MKLVFALSTLVFGLSTHASTLSNAEARLQLQRLLFGNDSTKTERLSVPGHQDNGDACTIRLRKTRFGVYVGLSKSANIGGMEAGITNSTFTTQNLDFALDEETVKFSRMGVTGINERGEDFGNETATLIFEKEGSVAKVKSLEVSYEAVNVDYDAKYNPIYNPSGEVHTEKCAAD